MGITVVVPAADHLLTTIEVVKAELSLSDSSEDLLIESYIEQASDLIKSVTGRTFAREQIKETIGAVGLPEILLSLTPIITVDEIKHDGTVVPAADYSILDDKVGILFKLSGWTSTEIAWNTFAKEHPSPYLKPDWEFTYTAGYILPNWSTVLAPRTLPHDLERACIEIVKTFRSGKTLDTSVTRYKTGDTDISFDKKMGFFSTSVQSVLNYYKRAF